MNVFKVLGLYISICYLLLTRKDGSTIGVKGSSTTSDLHQEMVDDALGIGPSLNERQLSEPRSISSAGRIDNFCFPVYPTGLLLQGKKGF